MRDLVTHHEECDLDDDCSCDTNQPIASPEVVPGRNVRNQLSGRRSATREATTPDTNVAPTGRRHKDGGASETTVIPAGPGLEVVNQHEAIDR